MSNLTDCVSRSNRSLATNFLNAADSKMQFYWCDGQTIFNLFFSLFFSLIIGLPEVLETSSIQAGCLWQYPCLAQNGPCIDGAVCFQKDYSGFKCECDRQSNNEKNSCVKEGFQEGVFGTNIPRGGRPVAVSFRFGWDPIKKYFFDGRSQSRHKQSFFM